MKTLLSTTALIALLGMPGIAFAQQTNTATDGMTRQENTEMAGFLARRGQSDLHASDLMGKAVHARRMTGENEPADQTMTSGSGMMTIERVQLDDMDQIGEINEIILSSDGQVRALVIGVGGFLGMGEHDVAMTMDQVTFATGSEDASEIYVIVNSGRDMLQGAPSYERDGQNAQAPRQDDGTERAATDAEPAADGDRETAARSSLVAPEIDRDGYRMVDMQDISTDMLTGKSVYDVNDTDVGEVSDMLIGEDGAISHVIIDFGGFLGIGSRQASLAYDELTVLSRDGDADDVRIYVDATEDQIRDLPRYMASN